MTVTSKTGCQLKYLVKDLRPTRESQRELARELTDNLPNAESVVVLPVVEGYTVEIEMHDISPFSTNSFEPYIAEHVLPEAVQIHCNVESQTKPQLLKARFN